MRLVKPISHICAFVFLTLLTQVGGIVYLISLFIARRFKANFKKSAFIFIGFYLINTLLIIPLVAPLFGRVPLPLSGSLRPINIMTCLLNRHYVGPELRDIMVSTSNQMSEAFNGTKTNYLDANFPFFNGFPLLPHLSHNDGKKVDLAFYYNDKASGNLTNSTPSFIGYGIYDGPEEGEINYPERCANKGYWQYGLLTKLIPKWKVDNYEVDSKRTTHLIKLLAEDNSTSKIFIEPHLKQRWRLNSIDKIRFHGCQAVRHDDHIHLQIK